MTWKTLTIYTRVARCCCHTAGARLTSEMRNTGVHVEYLGSEEEAFDADAAMNEAKFTFPYQTYEVLASNVPAYTFATG